MHGAQGEPAIGLADHAPLETHNGASTTAGPRLTVEALKKGAERAAILRAAAPLWGKFSLLEIASSTGTSPATLCRLRQRYGHLNIEDLTATRLASDVCNNGRKADFIPSASEVAVVRAIFVKLDESRERSLGRGSSRIAAFRMAAKGFRAQGETVCRAEDDGLVSERFKCFVLGRKRKDLPKSWLNLLDLPHSVLAYGRDQRSTMAAHVSTPRGRTWVDPRGNEQILRVGDIFEADDGTLNFYAWVPWPFGGDKCSEKFGVKLGRWQLLVVVDAASEMCVTWDIVARNAASYRAEDAGSLLGRAMLEELVPQLFRLERGSWESKFVRELLKFARVPCINAWHSKQKSAVERFFDRLWTPASLIRGHVGRDRGRFKHVEDIALACHDGRRDPRDYFLEQSIAVAEVMKCVQYVNSEPIESGSGWGRWVPEQRYREQTNSTNRHRLDPSLAVFFSREQKTWTVRKATLGGNVDCLAIKFPVYFQCQELWEFEGCKVKCYFDPYLDEPLATLVLQQDWRGHKTGHVIATGVPSLELPPQAVLAEDGWAGQEASRRSLAVRKAISKAVRVEYCNWRGVRGAETRDGLLGRSVRDPKPLQPERTQLAMPEPQRTRRNSPMDQQGMERNDDILEKLAARARENKFIDD